MIVDCFAGAGGWDEGARIAGYTGPLVGVEWDMDACRTAMAAGHARVRADVAVFPLGQLVGRVDGLISSPPCPTWSAAGDGAGRVDLPLVLRLIADYAAGREPAFYEWEDKRSALTAQPMRWAQVLRPRWIACEQVPPVLPVWQYMADRLRGLGYRAWAGVLSAEEYATPQSRKRAVLIARLDGPALPPEPTHQAYVAGRAPESQDDLFGSPLPAPVSMATALGWSPLCTRSIDEPAGTLFFGQRHHAVDWVLRSNYGTGGDPQDRGERTPEEPAATVTSKIDRAKWIYTRPSTTVCADARIGRPGHKNRGQGEAQFAEDSVRVSVEEAGILQSFRADYPWSGTSTKRYLQCGNAVPPLLAAAILRPLLARADTRGVAA